jgi:uncharacterized repeat protein (TIGR01451 family)
VSAFLLVSAGAAQAYTTAPGWIATDYATNFPHFTGDRAGPVGLAFDSQANLLVTDPAAGALYKIPPGGGDAAQHKLKDGYGLAGGLAYDKQGRLYMARSDKHDIVEINPASGDILRTLNAGQPCPLALATDPVSGDMFSSNVFCAGGSIMRVNMSSGVARSYTPGQDSDGLTFGPDGTLYAAADGKVLRIAGTSSSSPGQTTVIQNVPGADGIAYAPATALDDEYLVVDRTDGEIDRLDFDGHITPIVTGASRGDLVTVGPDRCIYATLQDRVITLGPATGQCNFSPPVSEQDVLGNRSPGRVVDMAIAMKAPKTVRRGSRFTLQMTARNRSANTAHSVVVTHTVPQGARFVKASSSKGVKCKRRGRNVTCRKASLGGKKSFTVKLVERSVRRKSYRDVARVKSSDLDPARGNNKSQKKTRVKARR